jgi:hypothetical protein
MSPVCSLNRSSAGFQSSPVPKFFVVLGVRWVTFFYGSRACPAITAAEIEQIVGGESQFMDLHHHATPSFGQRLSRWD